MIPQRRSFERFVRNWVSETEQALPDVSPDAAIERLLQAQRELARNGQNRRSAGRRRWIAAGAAASFAAAAALILLRAGKSHTFTVDSSPAVVGARVQAFGKPRVVEFSEGSTIKVDAQSSLSVQAIGDRGASLALERGEVDVDIVPRRGARWSVSAGPFQVHVLGTAFHVEWLPDRQHFSVSVLRGTVQVEGPMVEQRPTLNAGERCVVDWGSHRYTVEKIGASVGAAIASAAELPDAPRPKDPAPVEAPAPSFEPPSLHQKHEGEKAASTPDKAAPTVQSWRELERAGQFQAAITEAERVGVDVIYDVSDAEGLMSLARAARFVGRADISGGALLSCRRRFPGTRNAAMAAFLLGSVASPVDAIGWFSTYLKEQPDGAWAREASGRLIEAYQATGAKSAAQDAAKRYLERYPGGPHAEFARRALPH